MRLCAADHEQTQCAGLDKGRKHACGTSSSAAIPGVVPAASDGKQARLWQCAEAGAWRRCLCRGLAD